MLRFWRNKKFYSFVLFVVGMFSHTQVVVYVGCIAISELPMLILGPILFLTDFTTLRRDGFLPMIFLIILSCCGGFVASLANDIYWIVALKGLAIPYSMFCVMVVMHRLLRGSFRGLGWFVAGHAVSLIIYIWAFNPVATMTTVMSGSQLVDELMENGYFWTIRIRALAMIPFVFWYLHIPRLISMLVPLGVAVTNLLVSISGRSSALYTIVASAIIFMGGRVRWQMRAIGQHFLLFLIVAGVVLYGIQKGYKIAASNGTLGEDAVRKYEKHTRAGDSALKILMSGRQEFFSAVRAALDKPFLGHGPHAIDKKGYYERFLQDYASEDEYQQYLIGRSRHNAAFSIIPTHSHLMAFWVWYGIFGLWLWLYVLYLMCKYFRCYAASVPQWFAYFAYCIPGLAWDIFFSPFGWRVYSTTIIVGLLYVKAVYERRIMLPIDMQTEIEEVEQKSLKGKAGIKI